MNSHNSQEVWQVSVQNRIYEADFEEIVQWIKEGAVLPEDKIRQGNLRWKEARQFPEFHQIFFENKAEKKSAATAENDLSQVYTHFQIGSSDVPSASVANQPINFSNAAPDKKAAASDNILSDELVCSVHADRDYHYVCKICGSLFCKDCPQSFGSNVKLCSHCGGMCAAHDAIEDFDVKAIGSINRPYLEAEAIINTNEPIDRTNLDKEDFIDAFLYPLRFPVVLVFCAGLFAILIIGQSFLAIGGGYLSAIAGGVSILTTMLVFSVLNKTIENILHKKNFTSFLPNLSIIGVWKDYIHPVFLGLSVYILSFGLLLGLIVCAGFYLRSDFQKDFNKVESETGGSQKRQNLTQNNNQIEMDIKNSPSLQTQFETVFGINYAGDATKLEKMFKSFWRTSVGFQMPISFAFLFGLILLPAVCVSAGSSRSFFKTVNPANALKIIKTFGFDYIKILTLGIAFLSVLLIAAGAIYLLFSAFGSPLAGIFAGLAAGGFLAFYFWLIFASILGTALRKKQLVQNAA